MFASCMYNELDELWIARTVYVANNSDPILFIAPCERAQGGPKLGRVSQDISLTQLRQA
jgi:hypothetical protein